MRPEILTQWNIPKPLHGLNPRSIKGKAWWDERRQEAYAKYNYRCAACGIHKLEAEFHQWLEAHESYFIDYRKGSCVLNEIIPLCHSCHNFIHSGRLGMMWKSGEISEEKALYILNRGFRILKSNNLEPFWGTAHTYSLITGREDLDDRIDELEKKQSISIQQDWAKWHIEIDGVKHFSKFKSYSDWKASYG